MLRHALRADLDAIADLFVDAFSADPFFRWIQPDDAAWPSFGRVWFGFVLGLTFERGHTYLSDRLDVATAWVPPDLDLVGEADLERAAALLSEHAGPERGREVLEVVLRARAHSVDAPHWTLQYLAVRTNRQGQGLGVTATMPMLAVIDAEALPCDLVSTNARNLPFYERLGFSVVGESASPDGAAVLRPMLRSGTSGARG